MPTQYRLHLVEVTVPWEDDEDETWRRIGQALEDAGFNDVLYGEALPLEAD